MVHPEKIIVGGVVNAIRTVKFEFHGGPAKKVQKDRKVRAASNARFHQVVIGHRPRVLRLNSRGRCRLAPFLIQAFPCWRWNLVTQLHYQRRERPNGARAKVGTGNRPIDIEISDQLLFQFLSELFSPLGGTGESHFFTVPTRHDERALRPEALRFHLTEGASHFHHRRRAARWVNRAELPAVPMIAKQNPLLGKLTASNSSFDHVIGHGLRIHVDFEMDANPAPAKTVLDGKAALPALRRNRAVQLFEQRFGVTPRHGHRHDLRHRNGLLHGNAPSAIDGGPARRERITGNQEIVCDGAPLNVTFRPPRAIRKNLATLVPVFSWI